MTLNIRATEPNDISQMTCILNEIIRIGGTTAYLEPKSDKEIAQWVARGGSQASWHVAEDRSGQILGFQWAEPHANLPKDAASVATFARVNSTGRGVGSRLFEATCAKARALGFVWLNASIRSDNLSGLSYYSKMGFVDWLVEPDAALTDGTITGKHHKRFDL